VRVDFSTLQQPQAALSAATDAKHLADESIQRADDVLERLDKLSLLCQAMWELLSERCQVTRDELMERVLEVDLRDGRADGRIGESILECPHCKNPVNSRFPKCVVCGTTVVTQHPFEI
jgi:hypothetical protein